MSTVASLAISAVLCLLIPSTLPSEVMTRDSVTAIVRDNPDAASILRGVVKDNPKDGWALFALGFIAQKSNHIADAATYYDRASRLLERSTELVFDRAIADNSTGKSRRSVGELLRFIQANPFAPEPFVDLLGHSLSRVEASALSQPNEIAAAALLADRSRALESAKPGFHKWGGDWLDGNGWNDLQRRLKDARAAVDEAKRRDGNALTDISVAQKRYSDACDRASRAGPSEVKSACADRDRLAGELSKAKRAEADTAAAIITATKAVPAPKWPAAFTPVF